MYQSAKVVMYFTARTFYFRVTGVVLWLPMADWLELLFGQRDVAVLGSLVCTTKYLLCVTG